MLIKDMYSKFLDTLEADIKAMNSDKTTKKPEWTNGEDILAILTAVAEYGTPDERERAVALSLAASAIIEEIANEKRVREKSKLTAFKGEQSGLRKPSNEQLEAKRRSLEASLEKDGTKLNTLQSYPIKPTSPAYKSQIAAFRAVTKRLNDADEALYDVESMISERS